MRSGRTAARARMRHVACAVLAGLVAGGIPAARSAAQAPPAQTPIVIHRLLQSTTTLTGQPLEFPLTENQVTAVLLEAAPGRGTGNTTLFFPTIAYVIDGTFTLEIPGRAASTVSGGQAVVLPLRTPINGVNNGTSQARVLLVYFGRHERPLVEHGADVGRTGLKRTTVLRTLTTWTGEAILFPLRANQVTALIAEFAPGAVNPRHVHPPTQFVYVLEGLTSVEPTDHARGTFKPGDALVETTIAHVGANRGSIRGRIFTVFAGEAGIPLTVPVP